MKILIINTSDIGGGAARAAHRLYEALSTEGIDSNMLVLDKKSDDYNIIGPKTNIEKLTYPYQGLLDSLAVRRYKNRTKALFSTSFISSKNIIKKINDINPDIVHLHWVCGGMIRIEDLRKIKAPIVWSLHDMWVFTGGCHYSDGCDLYTHDCGTCKVLGSNKTNDLSHKIWLRKQKVFSQISNITIVGLSKWMNTAARNSSLLSGKNNINLPNPINTEAFKQCDKRDSRRLWNLPRDKKLILFGAIGATSDPRKGFKELSESLEKIKDSNIEIIIFGSCKPKDGDSFPLKTHYVGQLHDTISLVTLYSSVDIMIVPSLQENLSNTIMESLSCSTPVLAFDIGGNSDMIEHKINGYLAKPFDTTDLAKGIKWILNNSNYDDICSNAREKVLKEFDSKIIAKKYIKLYKKILNNIRK